MVGHDPQEDSWAGLQWSCDLSALIESTDLIFWNLQIVRSTHRVCITNSDNLHQDSLWRDMDSRRSIYVKSYLFKNRNISLKGLCFCHPVFLALWCFASFCMFWYELWRLLSKIYSWTVKVRAKKKQLWFRFQSKGLHPPPSLTPRSSGNLHSYGDFRSPVEVIDGSQLSVPGSGGHLANLDEKHWFYLHWDFRATRVKTKCSFLAERQLNIGLSLQWLETDCG